MIEMIEEYAQLYQKWTLWDEITGNIKDYKDLLSALRYANEGDVIDLDIESIGGDCATGFKIIEHMKESKAHINCIVSGESYSMGSLIALAGDNLKLKPKTFLMFHTFSYGTHGKSGDINAKVLNTDKLAKIQTADVAMPFLSEKELSQMHDGKEIYIWWDDPTLYTRIKRHFKPR